MPSAADLEGLVLAVYKSGSSSGIDSSNDRSSSTATVQHQVAEIMDLMQKETQFRALFSVPKDLIDRFRLFAAETASLPEPRQHVEQAPNGKEAKSSQDGTAAPDTTETQQQQQLVAVAMGAGQGEAGTTGAAAEQAQEQQQEKQQVLEQEEQQGQGREEQSQDPLSTASCV